MPARSKATPDPSAPGSPRQKLAIVAAVAANGVIGADGGLPWRLADDLRHFRALTLGHAVIMGRRTRESLAGPLAGRQNIVVSSRPDYRPPGTEVAASLEEALARVSLPPPAFCIGGAVLYRDAIERADTMHLTEIDREFPGDVRFPPFDRGAWLEVRREDRRSNEGFGYAFVTYERRSPARG